ncbi:hypothetical protein [Nocardioides solisilvae]|uniref:hypothetical protein n=1 Tax=Nocardioides solisilvae TaxID=1542435 RepID=UPI000D749A62|nr:hypothetical protein [Nocardioides solisilvae]
MRVVEVDERDSAWEDDGPRFRVYLHSSGEDATFGSTATYDVTGADVLQVVDWAQRVAGEDLTYAVALVRDEPRTYEAPGTPPRRGLVWLVGRDGNDVTDDDPVCADAQRRMLLRRRDPVVVPEADRAPDGVRIPGLPGFRT